MFWSTALHKYTSWNGSLSADSRSSPSTEFTAKSVFNPIRPMISCDNDLQHSGHLCSKYLPGLSPKPRGWAGQQGLHSMFLSQLKLNSCLSQIQMMDSCSQQDHKKLVQMLIANLSTCRCTAWCVNLHLSNDFFRRRWSKWHKASIPFFLTMVSLHPFKHLFGCAQSEGMWKVRRASATAPLSSSWGICVSINWTKTAKASEVPIKSEWAQHSKKLCTNPAAQSLKQIGHFSLVPYQHNAIEFTNTPSLLGNVQ